MRKKVLTIVLSVLFSFSIASCADTSKSEPKNLENMQETTAPTPRSLSERNDILEELQSEYDALQSEYDSLDENDEKRREILQKIVDNLAEQSEIIAGNEGEENLRSIVDTTD